MSMTISFPGGARVDADFKGFQIRTDQPTYAGGEGSAPAPFDLFLASIGTCAGLYAHDFLRQRKLPTEGLTLTLDTEKDPATKRIARIVLRVVLPAGVPQKYEGAIARAIDLCAVKRHISEPPEFETVLERAETPEQVQAGR